MSKTCGRCNHFERAGPCRWGVCCAPLPKWLRDAECLEAANMVRPGDAEDCGCFDDHSDASGRR